MPRKPRLSIPGALHHVMARGIEGRPIFNDDEDRKFFLSLLAEGIAETGFKCYAWVLMNNHYHLLLRVNEVELCSMMRPLNSKYARWFRTKNKGRGYLFQDRFKSLVTQDQGYLEELVRYIHLNPVRAGICRTLSELDNYQWSGHVVLMGSVKCLFQETGAVLNRFGHDPAIARREYRQFLSAATRRDVKKELIADFRKGSNEKIDRHDHRCWVIGDPEFVAAALENDRAKRIRVASYVKKGWNIQAVAEKVAEQMKIDIGEIARRGRRNDRSMLRKVVAALAHRACGIPIIEIARFYGVAGSSVSRMMDQGERYVSDNKIQLKQ